MNKNKVIDLDKELTELRESVSHVENKSEILLDDIESTSDSLAELQERLLHLGIAKKSLVVTEDNITKEISELNYVIKDIDHSKFGGDVSLTVIDLIVSVVSGIVASVIDIVFVGTPEVVKIYKGGENFDGSILTKAIRSLGQGDDTLSGMLDWCCEKCKVPYDISAKKGVVIPNNHRLRNFAHDPLIGMLFAIVDIIMGTGTFVDNKGNLRIVVNPKDYPQNEKVLALIYYFGHLLSDVCTARGLPIPGFVLTQFFAGEDDSSVAAIAEQMYRDGYDLRHLASMSTPVLVKNLVIEIYLSLLRYNNEVILTLAEKEIINNKNEIYRYKLRLMSDAVCCGGNVLKFFIPPTMGNITALNISEWISLIQNSIVNLRYQIRDKSIEQVIFNREIISDNWNTIMKSR
ncbi:MAG: hypothetical protein IJI75_13815 [Solobacterium sp.]|nr:hypothetical protein [Solobacterium sp.]